MLDLLVREDLRDVQDEPAGNPAALRSSTQARLGRVTSTRSSSAVN